MLGGQGPEQTDMEKRLLMAMLLSMAVLLLIPFLYQRLGPTPAPVAVETPEEQRVEEKRVESEPSQERISQESRGSSEPLSPTQGQNRKIQVENDDMVLTWSSTGARLKSVYLKRYTDESGEPVELLVQGLSETLPRPMQLRLDDEELDLELATSPFEVAGAALGRVQAPAQIGFSYRSQGLLVEEEISIPQSGHTLEVRTRVELGGRPAAYSVLLGPGIGQADPEEGTSTDFWWPGVAYYAAGSVEKYDASDLAEGAHRIETSARWVAVDSKYFTCVVIAPDEIRAARLSAVSWPGEDGGESDGTPLVLGEAEFRGTARYTLFLGPKDQEELALADPFLGDIIDYGWFDVLVKPLLYCLKLTYAYVGNYGVAIIILTFLINLALFPLRYKQIASMKKMSELQPRIRSIQDRYKRMKRTDPRRQQMNPEMMGLYKQHGVNPLGGCLPLVIQMPFLFAFYRMLDSSIELRAAPFMGWIQDLSRHDPYYITPIVMGVSMVVQQKMTPTAGDPMQKRMMMLLPVVFTFFFLNLSSGLVVYFLFSNLFAMMFQVLMQRWKPELAPKRKSLPKKTRKK
jgi:YidC/Oxa1 family membrane protein insertase